MYGVGGGQLEVKTVTVRVKGSSEESGGRGFSASRDQVICLFCYILFYIVF